MRRVLKLLPILGFLMLTACDYATNPPGADPSVGTVRQSPNTAPQS